MLFIYSYKDYLYGRIACQQYSIMFLWQMKLGRIHDHFEILYDDDEDDDDSEHGDIHNDDVGGEDEHRFLNADKKGFIFSAVQHSDDDTYKCEAKKQNQQEVMYFYMHVGK
jgi:hypothetical protein